MLDPPFPIPACFSSDNPTSPFASAKPRQSVVTSVHRTKIAGQSRLITVTWCRNILLHGLCVSILPPESEPTADSSLATSTCKVELKPWLFWRKNGSKNFHVAGHTIHVYWDLRTAKYSGEPEPQSDYYVAVVSDNEVVLLLGDMKKEACKKTSCRPAAIEAGLVSKKEHVFGKKRFSTRTRFSEKGRYHEVSIECGMRGGAKLDPQMVVKIDGQVAIHVKHLQWKFRGNETVSMISKERVEVYWDVHDWLFSPGMRHALFIFKPLPAVRSSFINGGGSDADQGVGLPSSPCCVFLYAWKIE